MGTILSILKFTALGYVALVLASAARIARPNPFAKALGVFGVVALLGIPFLVGYQVFSALFPSTSTTPMTASEQPATEVPMSGEGNLSDGARVSATIFNVVNGDSLEVSFDGTTTESVRLLGVDTPEAGMCFFGESAQRVDALQNTSVILEADPTQTNRDKFGRLWRYVWLSDGRMLNQVLIEEGYAFEYTYFTTYTHQDEFRMAQEHAQASGLGIWAATGCNGAGERPDRELADINLQMPSDVVAATVVLDVDGDTFAVEIEGQREYVRFVGIDTPESSNCYYSEASERTAVLTNGETVWLEPDRTQADRDAYGRLLRFVWLSDGRLLNALLVQEGYAYEYTYNTEYRYQAEFMQLEHLAQRAGLGLWSPQTCDGLAGRRFSDAYNNN